MGLLLALTGVVGVMGGAALEETIVANWVKCTRRVDEKPIYVNLDTAMTVRWNEDEKFTVVMWSKDDLVRVLETLEEILEKIGQSPQQANAIVSTATKKR